MKQVTIEEFLKFDPCYCEEEIREITGNKKEWDALDVLGLEQIPPEDRLWAVLREEFIEGTLLQEFGCRCAERYIAKMEQPRIELLNALKTKRAWLRGEISELELKDARRDAWNSRSTGTWMIMSNQIAHWASCWLDSIEEVQWQIEGLKKMLEVKE